MYILVDLTFNCVFGPDLFDSSLVKDRSTGQNHLSTGFVLFWVASGSKDSVHTQILVSDPLTQLASGNGQPGKSYSQRFPSIWSC